MSDTPTIGGTVSTLSRPQLVPGHAAPSPDDTRPHGNPNAGKRRLAAHVRTPRTTGPRSTVTITRVDPDYLARYGSEAAQRAADRAQRTGKPAPGNATVVTRSATTRTLRALTLTESLHLTP